MASGRRTGRSDDERVVALLEDLGAQLGRLKGGGPKILQFLSMVQLDRTSGGERAPAALGTLEPGASAPFGRVRKVIEQDCHERLGELFCDIDEEPVALSSLGQLHRARTRDGDDVAVKVQHAGLAEAVEADLRKVGLVAPIVKRLAPGLEAGAVLAELRDRIADELDYEIEAQHLRRLGRRFRGHPHVRVPAVRTDLSARRVLVTEYVDGMDAGEIRQLGNSERDRIGEIVFRFYLGLAWRDGIVAGDPHPDNCILCPDGRLCLLDFGLVRDLDMEYIEGERDVMRAVAEEDSQQLHDRLSGLGYLPDASSFDPGELLEFLGVAGEWMLAAGGRRVDPTYVAHVVELGYPPQSPYFPLIRRLSLPAATLLLRRMELQVLSVLGDFNAAADCAAITAEHHSDRPPSTALGDEDHTFFGRRAA